MGDGLLDVDRRKIVLKRFYDHRHTSGWIPMPSDLTLSDQERMIEVSICDQLYKSSQIEWKQLAGMSEGSGRIRALGVDVIESDLGIYTDAIKRHEVLKRLYSFRHNQGPTPVPSSLAAFPPEQIMEVNICRQLFDGGLIEMKAAPDGGPSMVKISKLGVDVIEGTIKPGIRVIGPTLLPSQPAKDTNEGQASSPKKENLYGGRWKIQGSITAGGQGEIFRVIDVSNQHPGIFALKRLKNPKRHERFMREIEAVRRLSHPNIIELLDHSALDSDDSEVQRKYLVMPLASGDLSAEGRTSLYAGSIENTLVVAKQLASALIEAHSRNVIHRDVKPANILFKNAGHDVWLADFGICLISDEKRLTDSQEIVGPRTFIAPELESSGVLEADKTADIYSLGKVIFYMLSGGKLLAREETDKELFKNVFVQGGQFHLMEVLLRRMISLKSTRILSMTEVLAELEKIEKRDGARIDAAISTTTRARIERMQKLAAEKQATNQSNEMARQAEKDARDITVRGVVEWLFALLQEAADTLSVSPLESQARKISMDKENFVIQTAPAVGMQVLGGAELYVRDVNDVFGRADWLQIFVAQQFSPKFQFGDKPTLRPEQDLQLSLFAMYQHKAMGDTPKGATRRGYITKGSSIGHWSEGYVPAKNARGPQKIQLSAVTQSFHKNLTLEATFLVSQWPDNVKQLEEMVSGALEVFTHYLEQGAKAIGL